MPLFSQAGAVGGWAERQAVLRVNQVDARLAEHRGVLRAGLLCTGRRLLVG